MHTNSELTHTVPLGLLWTWVEVSCSTRVSIRRTTSRHECVRTERRLTGVVLVLICRYTDGVFTLELFGEDKTWAIRVRIASRFA